MKQLDSLRSLAGAAGCLLLLALLSACRQGSPAPATQDAAQSTESRATPTPEINEKEDSKVADHAYEKQSATPPAPDAVLYFIYNKDGDGATSYEIENGSVATYWYGHQFDLRGKHYFAGFAYSTPEKFGAAEDEPNPAPGSKVTLANATFVLSKPGTEKPWSLVGAEPYSGEFGAYEKGDEVDPKRNAVSYETGDGQFVLAVPTTSLQSGSELTGYAVLRFQPGELEDIDDHHWRYLGTIWTGEDNSAACDEGEVMPCAASSGTLAFKPGGQALPDILVTPQGTTIASPGKTRTLGPEDRSTYTYDPRKKEYVAKSGS
jgi:hypothetical protein